MRTKCSHRRNTELARVPAHFRPLSSSRGRVCSMGRLVCTLICNAVNTDRSLGGEHVDGCIIMGGNIRGGADYSPEFSSLWKHWKRKVKPEEVVGIVEMPGWLLSEGVRATHRGDPIPGDSVSLALTRCPPRRHRCNKCSRAGWFQYGDGIEEDEAADAITMCGGNHRER